MLRLLGKSHISFDQSYSVTVLDYIVTETSFLSMDNSDLVDKKCSEIFQFRFDMNLRDMCCRKLRFQASAIQQGTVSA